LPLLLQLYLIPSDVETTFNSSPFKCFLTSCRIIAPYCWCLWVLVPSFRNWNCQPNQHKYLKERRTMSTNLQKVRKPWLPKSQASLKHFLPSALRMRQVLPMFFPHVSCNDRKLLRIQIVAVYWKGFTSYWLYSQGKGFQAKKYTGSEIRWHNTHKYMISWSVCWF